MTNETIKDLVLEAKKENLDKVMSFIETCLENTSCSAKAMMQINLAVEEIYINVASYAYGAGSGDVTVKVEADPHIVSITFIDSGIPYDPLKKPDPDVTLSAEERSIGGLGIFLTKKFMDDVIYEYKDGKNILTLKKQF